MHKLLDKIQSTLEKMPGQSVKELAEKLGVNRNLLTGYLQALEELGYVTSRKIGPARVYNFYNIDSSKGEIGQHRPVAKSRRGSNTNIFKSGR